MITGAVHTRNTASSEYKPVRLNATRKRRVNASTSAIEISSIAFVYFARNPSPISSPVNGHHQLNSTPFSSASQKVYSAAAQKKMERGSIVISSPPTLKIG